MHLNAGDFESAIALCLLLDKGVGKNADELMLLSKFNIENHGSSDEDEQHMATNEMLQDWYMKYIKKQFKTELKSSTSSGSTASCYWEVKCNNLQHHLLLLFLWPILQSNYQFYHASQNIPKNFNSSNIIQLTMITININNNMEIME